MCKTPICIDAALTVPGILIMAICPSTKKERLTSNLTHMLLILSGYPPPLLLVVTFSCLGRT